MNENIVQARENRYVQRIPNQLIRDKADYSIRALSNNDFPEKQTADL
jgi:hypothetical protein